MYDSRKPVSCKIPPGGTTSKIGWGVCDPLPKSFALFMTIICYITYPIYDLRPYTPPLRCNEDDDDDLRLDPKFDVGLKRNFSLVLVARTYYTEDIVKYLSLLNKVFLTYLIYRGCPAISCYVR